MTFESKFSTGQNFFTLKQTEIAITLNLVARFKF